MKLDSKAVKALQTATTVAGVEDAIVSLGRNPGPLLVQQINEESKKRGFRLFLLIMASLCICVVTYFAYVGGGYIAQYTGPMALIFGVLDLSIVILLFADAVKGKLRLFVLIFEIASLAYLGYAMGGYFGGGNLKTAAEKKLAADFSVAKEHFTAAQSTAELLQRSIDNASSVAAVESKRDGKGVVFEKASFISLMKPTTFPLVDSLPAVPVFADLTDANKWIQAQRQIVADNISKYDAGISAMNNQAKSTKSSLDEALKMSLSQQQISNLQVLAASMEQIAQKEIPSSKISDGVLTPADLKADGFQSYIGFIVDVVIIFFILMLALQKSSAKNIEEIRDEEIRSLIEDGLSEDGLMYDETMVGKISAKKQLEALKVILDSDDLKNYVKSRTTFHEFLQFMQEQPGLARALGGSLWQISEIKREIRDNSSFGKNVEVISISPSDWKVVNEMVESPEQVFEMQPETRRKFLRVLKQIRTKAQLRPEELKKFTEQFLLIEKPTDQAMETLEECASTLSSAANLKALTGAFIENASPTVANFLCTNTENEQQFAKIVKGWTVNADDSMKEILSNGIVDDPQFDRLIKGIINWGGMDGLKKVFQVYASKKKDLTSGSIGNKQLVLNPRFDSIQRALENGRSDDFMTELENAFEVKSVTTSF